MHAASVRSLEFGIRNKALNIDLKEEIATRKQLSGMLPICASCKNIRNDKGYWEKLESYFKDHSMVEFSHSICPECAKKLYPEIYKKDLEIIE